MVNYSSWTRTLRVETKWYKIIRIKLQNLLTRIHNLRINYQFIFLGSMTKLIKLFLNSLMHTRRDRRWKSFSWDILRACTLSDKRRSTSRLRKAISALLESVEVSCMWRNLLKNSQNPKLKKSAERMYLQASPRF